MQKTDTSGAGELNRLGFQQRQTQCRPRCASDLRWRGCLQLASQRAGHAVAWYKMVQEDSGPAVEPKKGGHLHSKIAISWRQIGKWSRNTYTFFLQFPTFNRANNLGSKHFPTAMPCLFTGCKDHAWCKVINSAARQVLVLTPAAESCCESWWQELGRCVRLFVGSVPWVQWT